MSIAIPSNPRNRIAPMAVRRFTLAEYQRLIDENFFVADERFELIDGSITEKMSRNPPHDAAVNRARRVIESALPVGWIVRVQSAVTTVDSQPDPDIAVARGDDVDYVHHHPGPSELALVVEVANTSLATDRGPKLSAYARGGVAVYWILNLDDRVLEVFSLPDSSASAYAKSVVLRLGDIATILLGGSESQPIAVGALLL